MDATFAGYRVVGADADGSDPGAAEATVPVVGPGRIAVVDAMEASSDRRVRLILLPPIDGDLVRRTVVRARSVDHPHLLPDVEVVEEGGRLGVVAPWTDGQTLARLLSVRGTITPAEVLTVLRPLAGALIAIGDAGLCHGALLPELVFFDADGRPRLAGAGAGLAIAAATGEDRILPVGAPHLAPEVARGAAPDIRADLFALGSLALFAATGRSAWPAEDVTEVLVQSTAGLWPHAEPRVTTPELAAIIDGLLSADPALRPPAAVVQAELRSAGRPCPVDLSPLWSGPDRADAPVGVDDEPPADTGPDGSSGEHAPWPPGAAARSAPPGADGWGPDDRAEPPSPDGPPPGRRGATSRRGPTRNGGRRTSGRSSADRRRRIRTAVVVASVVVIGGLTVGGGLWWAAADTSTGAVAGPAGNDATPTGIADVPDLPVPSPVAAPVDWLSVVRELDRRRADALATADPDLLDTVYVDGAAEDADRSLVADLRSRGLRIDGGTHVITTAAVVTDAGPADAGPPASGHSDLQVRVGRSLPSYPVLDATGRAVGSTPATGPGEAVLTLRAVGDGYAIVAVGSA